MGFLRKALFVSTGGMSGLVVGLNSKKERIARAVEKQVRIQEAQAAQFAQTHQGGPAQPKANHLTGLSPTRSAVDEIERLAQLRAKGLLSDEEFVAAKKKVLE